MDLTPIQKPEEKELELKLGELAALADDLAHRELEVAMLRAELRAFEQRYLQIVGFLYVQLDEIETQIAESQARQHPNDTGWEEQAVEARARAEESARVVAVAWQAGGGPKFNPSERLRKLYREAAKRMHPDLAVNAEDRAVRTSFMARANRAYEESDEDGLRTLLQDWELRPESIAGETVGDKIVRTIRKIAQVRKGLDDVTAEITSLRNSDLYRLKAAVEKAERAGCDLLAEMASQVRQQIVSGQTRLQNLLGRAP